VKTSVRDFLVDIAENEIIKDKAYSVRIEVDDGGINSYVSLCVDVNDWNKKKPVTQALRLFRHSNSVGKKTNEWAFHVGDICNTYFDYPDIPMYFGSYGVTIVDAEEEAAKYFSKLKNLIKKQTSIYKAESAKSAEEERAQLLARLNELEQLN